MLRDSYLLIDLDLFHQNMQVLKNQWGHSEILAVLKANAYGHGAQVMAEALRDEGIDYFAVATLNEAIELRRSFSDRLLILTTTPKRLYNNVLEFDFIQSISSLEEGLGLIEVGSILGIKPRAEIKIDTGFHRFGFPCQDKSLDEIINLHEKGLKIEGIYSHLSLTSEVEDELQFQCFIDFTDRLTNRGLSLKRHIADSIASINKKEYQLERIRPGAIVFGMRSFKKELPILPIASLYTRICHLVKVEIGEGVGYDYTWKADKKSIIAQLPLGYADGLPRALGSQGYVMLKGKKAPMVGIMCMDVISIDVTDIPGVEKGDEVLIFGSGSQGEMTVAYIAGLLKTNKNEILSKLHRRLPRVYKNKGKKRVVDELLGEDYECFD
ncbi:MAG: alanine racemase [Tissierellia bacterium]|nr:alanine racemase [Tissierellia bacterium]